MVFHKALEFKDRGSDFQFSLLLFIWANYLASLHLTYLVGQTI